MEVSEEAVAAMNKADVTVQEGSPLWCAFAWPKRF